MALDGNWRINFCDEKIYYFSFTFYFGHKKMIDIIFYFFIYNIEIHFFDAFASKNIMGDKYGIVDDKK